MPEALYSVYILACADGTYYTGITNDIKKRVSMHNEGKGAKYTRGRTPTRLVYSEEIGTIGQARSREATLKKFSRIEKESLIANQPGMP